jgi:signal transduction histidine kinase
MYEEFLQKVPLFAELPLEDLSQLCMMTQEVHLKAGQVLLHEGSVADRAYILYDGALEILKNIDGREVLIDVHEQPGTVIGEMALLDETTRQATVRARHDSFLLTLDRYQFNGLLSMSATAAHIMIQTLTERLRNTKALVRHNERMAQLGTLTAGMAHELNNPAAAVVRGANQLHNLIDASERDRLAVERLDLTAEQMAKMDALMDRVRAAAAAPLALDPITRGDNEDALETWLDEQDVADAWELAPALVDLDLKPADLAELAEKFSLQALPVVLKRLGAAYSLHALLGEISQGAGRVVEIVNGLKSYVYLDQAPVQNVDIHAGLDDTLIFLHSRLDPGIRVKREYGEGLPHISAYASELNQVWTKIIDNAIWALDGKGEIIIRTRHCTEDEGDGVVVEIEDNGPGIPAANLPKIFDPFFTTRPPGQGAGLGLNVSYNIVKRHGGNIIATSEPGRTVFKVSLPLAPPS